MLEFLRSPKWLAGHLLVVALVVAFVTAGLWQLDRLDQARARNAAVAETMSGAPEPVDEALGSGAPDYRRVSAAGTYLGEHQLLSTPASRDGQPGHHVLTPLETERGPILLVDRGWVPFDRDGVPEDLLVPPEGEVVVSGLLMPPEELDPGEGEFLGAIDPEAASARTGLELAPRHLQLLSQDPPLEGPLPHDQPVLDEGNHFSYAMQWFLFAAVGVVGYPILLWRTARDRRGSAAEEGAAPTA